ncbi:MAG: DNA polymerase III subunit delta [Actinomycetota bacterium]|nr:DNA polymerase III subunit delta [Actinomycetota bacterium]
MSAPFYLLSGESYLAEEALDRVRKETGADPLSEIAFTSEAPGVEIVEALSTRSLLGGTRLVIVEDADGLNKEQSDVLARYLEAPSPDSVLVLIASGRSKLDATAKKLGAVITLEPPKGKRLVAWLKDHAQPHGLSLDDRAAWALIDSVGSELRDLDGALAQIASGSGGEQRRVTAAEVRKAFPRLADERIYALTDAVSDRKLQPSMIALRRLLQQGDDPLVLWGALVGQFRRLLKVRRIADLSARAVADQMGLPTWRAERLQRQARLFREEELVDAMETLALTDIELKSGDVPPEAALERAVIELIDRDAVSQG